MARANRTESAEVVDCGRFSAQGYVDSDVKKDNVSLK